MCNADAIETICQLTKYDHICAIKRNRIYIYTYVYIYSRKSTRNLGSYRGLLLAVESFISDALVLMLFRACADLYDTSLKFLHSLEMC